MNLNADKYVLFLNPYPVGCVVAKDCLRSFIRFTNIDYH